MKLMGLKLSAAALAVHVSEGGANKLFAENGTSYFTTHSFSHPFEHSAVKFDDRGIDEFHFHVYFYVRTTTTL
jgi:hypothetical protein